MSKCRISEQSSQILSHFDRNIIRSKGLTS